jgi:hypothetical protein
MALEYVGGGKFRHVGGRDAYFLVRPGGNTERILTTWQKRANAWAALADKQARQIYADYDYFEHHTGSTFHVGSIVVKVPGYTDSYRERAKGKPTLPDGWRIAAGKETNRRNRAVIDQRSSSGRKLVAEFAETRPASVMEITRWVFEDPRYVAARMDWHFIGEEIVVVMRESYPDCKLKCPEDCMRLKRSEYWQRVEEYALLHCDGDGY